MITFTKWPGLLVPYFTNKWQIHQKGLDVRIDLGGRMSQTIVGMIMLIEYKVAAKPIEESKKDEELSQR
jgi:hypothetical protein